MTKRKASEPDAEGGATAATSSNSGDPLSNVMYIGHLPHGFYEKQIKEYFAQFGKVTKIRVSRNKKSGASKHYAFVEFQSPEVAKVASDAMNDYMLFGQKIQSRAMRRSEVHADLFKGANRFFKRMPWRQMEIERHNKELTAQEEGRRTRSAVRRDRLRQQRINDAGIDYDCAGVATKVPVKAKKMRFNETE